MLDENRQTSALQNMCLDIVCCLESEPAPAPQGWCERRCRCPRRRRRRRRPPPPGCSPAWQGSPGQVKLVLEHLDHGMLQF